ncbi:MAG: putative methyltransferase [Planctomycetota bacterium]|jgi:predicted methyltransferase
MTNFNLLPNGLAAGAISLATLTTLGLGLFAVSEPAPVESAAPHDPVSWAVNHKDRLASDLDRDADRLPVRVLDFFDIKRGQSVADLMAGDGYYTEILSRAVGEDGAVYCQNTEIPLKVFADRPLTERLAEGRLPNVVRLDREFDDAGLPEAGLDAAILVRFYHDFAWQEVDRPAFNQVVFDSIKPGGLFGVVDHHAKKDAGITEGKRLHRVEASMVQQEIEAAGFVLEAESYVLFDETDPMDWSIFDPKHEGRDTTSRFVYLFRKPLNQGE